MILAIINAFTIGHIKKKKAVSVKINERIIVVLFITEIKALNIQH